MKTLVLAKRYAKALFELAQEKNILEAVASEVLAFQKTISENPKLQHFFLSPEVGRGGKEKLIEEKFQDQFSALFINFLFVLLKKGRQNIYDDIVTEFGRKYDQYHNRVRASAITATPLTPTDVEELKIRLAKQFPATYEIKNSVDPEILGGLILKVDGKVIDASLRTQLQQLRKNLLIERN